MAGDVKHARELIAEAGKHAEGEPQGCDCDRPGCGSQTYCTWCDNEWPCLTRELADALKAMLPGDDDWEYRWGDRQHYAFSDDSRYEVFGSCIEAKVALNRESDRHEDRVFRRRPAGPWEPVEEVPDALG